MKLTTYLVFLAAMMTHGALTVAPTLSDNMVLQRGCPIVLWGTAPSGQSVSARFDDGAEEYTTSRNGQWQLALPARESSRQPLTLVISAGSDKLELKNLLIGDVWYCAGQSNMAMAVYRADGKEEAATYTGNGEIRFLHLEKSPFTKPITSEVAKRLAPTPANKTAFYKINPWQRCDSPDLKSLSAVAYWFAHSLHEDLAVPIGLIVPALGGSSVQAWVSRASFEKDPALRPLLARWIDDEPANLQKQLQPWRQANPGASFDQTPLHRHRPTTLFETAVAPMARHAVRGVIWYQGEQNAQNAVQARWHELAFPHLVADFRENWKQPELPFYYVQLPGFGSDEWPAFREQQRQFLRIPHSGMAVTIDLGDAANIHPKDKPPIGERLARLALKNTYGKTVVASGPSPHNASAIGAGAVRIQFTDSAKGLSSTANPTPGFELAGADKQFVPAVAILSGRDEVRVTAKAITQPKYVRYAWAGFPRPLTLINSEGLPTGPFVEELQD